MWDEASWQGTGAFPIAMSVHVVGETSSRTQVLRPCSEYITEESQPLNKNYFRFLIYHADMFYFLDHPIL